MCDRLWCSRARKPGRITGWVNRAAEVFGVEFHVVDIDPGLRDAIVATQGRQKMVNVDLSAAADDLTIQE